MSTPYDFIEQFEGSNRLEIVVVKRRNYGFIHYEGESFTSTVEFAFLFVDYAQAYEMLPSFAKRLGGSLIEYDIMFWAGAIALEDQEYSRELGEMRS